MNASTKYPPNRNTKLDHQSYNLAAMCAQSRLDVNVLSETIADKEDAMHRRSGVNKVSGTHAVREGEMHKSPQERPCAFRCIPGVDDVATGRYRHSQHPTTTVGAIGCRHMYRVGCRLDSTSAVALGAACEGGFRDLQGSYVYSFTKCVTEQIYVGGKPGTPPRCMCFKRFSMEKLYPAMYTYINIHACVRNIYTHECPHMHAHTQVACKKMHA